jgi:uncharacterized membrane protein YcaP (DUF421 family)
MIAEMDEDTSSFGQKSIGQMSFSQQIMIMSVGQNVRMLSHLWMHQEHALLASVIFAVI